jgi:putative transcriptional regulator
MGRVATRNTKVGKRIVEGLTELVESVERGEPVEKRFTVRTVELKLKPRDYDAQSVRATRLSLGVSQAIFARILGSSVQAVEAWEQGLRRPQAMARRLLDEINRNRQYWLKLVRSAARARQTTGC